MPTERPELTTTPEWRADMLRARDAKGLSQGQLGQAAGTSQNMISLIESGAVGRSSFILPICETLEIAPPAHGDPADQRWVELGHKLRNRNQKVFARALALVESMLGDEEDEGSNK